MTDPALVLIKPLDSLVLAAIQSVAAAAAAEHVPFMIIGATARDILLEHVLGRPPTRATRDVDFAIAVQTWDAFNRVHQHLLNEGFKADGPHKLRGTLKGMGAASQQLEIDLLPFGGVEASGEPTVKWPPDAAIFFNVAGYADAMATALSVEVEPGLTVKVASLPAFAAMKLLAWHDRRLQNDGKDGGDFVALLRQYGEAGNRDRIYEGEGRSYLDSVNYQPELVAAWLLGRDTRRVSSEYTLQRLFKILDDPRAGRRLIDASLRLKTGGQDEADELSMGDHLRCFEQGLRSP